MTSYVIHLGIVSVIAAASTYAILCAFERASDDQSNNNDSQDKRQKENRS